MGLRGGGGGEGERVGWERGEESGVGEVGKSKRWFLVTLIMQTHIHSIYTSTDLNHTHTDTHTREPDSCKHTHTQHSHRPALLYGPGVSLRNEMPTLMWLSIDTLTLYATTSPTN